MTFLSSNERKMNCKISFYDTVSRYFKVVLSSQLFRSTTTEYCNIKGYYGSYGEECHTIKQLMAFLRYYLQETVSLLFKLFYDYLYMNASRNVAKNRAPANSNSINNKSCGFIDPPGPM